MDDYDANIDQAQRTHKGTVFGAFRKEWRLAEPHLSQIGTVRGWWAYQGRQARPFLAYTRFQPGRLTVAVLAGKGQGKKRMPVICDALDRLAWDAELTLRFETVMHQGLRGFLLARGYRYADGVPAMHPDLIYDPRRP